MLVYEFKVKANQQQSKAINEAIRIGQFIRNKCLHLYHQARFTSTLLWSGSVGLFTIGNAIALALAAYLWQRQGLLLALPI
nr:hypothetical protein [Stanieria cyanosphaera]